MKKYLALLLCSLCLTACAKIATEAPRYKNPTGNRFPILAWFSIADDSAVTHQRYLEMQEAGFNISFSHFGRAKLVAKALEACKGTGVKQMIMCSELTDQTVATVNQFKNDSMVAGWFLRDEPVAKDFPQLLDYRDRIYQADTNHLTYLNLFPDLLDPEDLGCKDYEDYVERFVNEVNLPQISFDQYPVIQDDKLVHLRPRYYENLEIARRVALKMHRPFWAFVLSTAHYDYPIPTKNQMRLQAFSDLAYGAQCIQYFTYWTPIDPKTDYNNAPINKDGKRTNTYYLCKALNHEIQSQAWVFLGAHAEKVEHTGDKIPQGTNRFTSLPAPFSSVTTDGEGLVVSQLVNGKNHFLMILNRDVNNTQKVTLKKSAAVNRVFHDGTVHKEKANSGETVNLESGDYLLYQL